ncbi:MAG: response regulator transcription factor [Candidatus Faecisoma sp.]|nr:response regulator transcription factor [Acholeplasma sp.]MCI5677386.1 response regulator transcription factor [Acholeplasma sp.]MDY2892376.1 response regulator transcription factor [Candidatus Faecisoma sp.]
MKILIVEDDSTIRSGLKYCLEYEQFEVREAALKSDIKNIDDIDLILLDVNLPDCSGFDLFKDLKKMKNIPIIFMTANDLEVNIVMGLDMGADDYITKPFKTRELIARVKNALRKNNNYNDKIKIGNVTIDLKQAKVFKNNQDVNLTAMEYKILLILATNPNKVFTRDNLLSLVWDVNSSFVYDNTLTVYIKRIREKIEDSIREPKIILTVRGLGYKIGALNEE